MNWKIVYKNSNIMKLECIENFIGILFIITTILIVMMIMLIVIMYFGEKFIKNQTKKRYEIEDIRSAHYSRDICTCANDNSKWNDDGERIDESEKAIRTEADLAKAFGRFAAISRKGKNECN